ncbi:MAG: coenzyme F420-0:L-glutamate ligase [Candidatus Heimdallarchaeaceae archaeon]
MKSIEVIPVPSFKIIEEGEDIVSIFIESMQTQNLSLMNKDIIVVASKAVSFSENRIVEFKEITPRVSELAKKVAKKAKIASEFAQVILEECNYNYIGTVPGAITTINEYGLLANAGADQSNVGENRIILLPENVKKSAEKFHKQILERTGKRVGVIIADSRTMPMRLGTVGCALGTYGFQAVIDERGKQDLFDRKMHITNRAIADQLATTAELLMGETNEQIPFVIIRNYPLIEITEEEERDVNKLIPAKSCMFIGPLLKGIEEKIEVEKNEN